MIHAHQGEILCSPHLLKLRPGVCPAVDLLIFLQLKPPTKHLLRVNGHCARHILLCQWGSPTPGEQVSKGGISITVSGEGKLREKGTCPRVMWLKRAKLGLKPSMTCAQRLASFQHPVSPKELGHGRGH